MNPLVWRLTDLVSLALEPAEREAVLGDLTEQHSAATAFRDVFGLVARRQGALWTTSRPWIVCALLVLPSAFLLALYATNTSGSSSVTLWLYFNNWDWSLFGLAAFRHDFPRFILGVLSAYLAMACWSWICGFLLGAASRRAITSTAAFFFLTLFTVQFAIPQLFHILPRARTYHPNDPVFSASFYRTALPLLVDFVLVYMPVIVGMRHGLRLQHRSKLSRRVLWTLAILSSGLLAFQIQFVYRALWRYLFPGAIGLNLSWPFHFHLLVYWPVLYWLTAAIQRRRRLLIA